MPSVAPVKAHARRRTARFHKLSGNRSAIDRHERRAGTPETWWRKRAATSLPTPLSPVSSTLLSTSWKDGLGSGSTITQAAARSAARPLRAWGAGARYVWVSPALDTVVALCPGPWPGMLEESDRIPREQAVLARCSMPSRADMTPRQRWRDHPQSSGRRQSMDQRRLAGTDLDVSVVCFGPMRAARSRATIATRRPARGRCAPRWTAASTSSIRAMSRACAG
jgi:hypothetical protein